MGGATGLIPSQFLEEKRKAFVPRDLDGTGEAFKHPNTHMHRETYIPLPYINVRHTV